MAEPIPLPSPPSQAEGHTLGEVEARKLIRDELDLRDKYMTFAQGQIEKDRSFYKYLYSFAAGFIALMVVVAGIFSYTSVSQMRTEMKASIEQATKTAVNQLEEQAAQNLKNVLEAANTQISTQLKQYSASLTNSQNATRTQERLATEQMRQALAQVARTRSELDDAQKQLAQIKSLASSNPTIPLGQIDPNLFHGVVSIKSYSRYSSPEDIKELQTRLNDLGCYNAEINGAFDESTLGAVKQFNHLKNPFLYQLSQGTPGVALFDDTSILGSDLLSPIAPHCSSTGN